MIHGPPCLFVAKNIQHNMMLYNHLLMVFFFNYRNILTIFGTLYKSSDFLHVNYWIINMIKHLLVWELRHFDLYPSLYMFFAHKAYCRLITTVTWRAISQVSTGKKYNFSFICFTYKTLYFFIQLLNLILLVLYA